MGIGRLKGPGPEENAERWLGIVRLDAGAKEEETRPARATVMAKMRMVVFMKRTVPFEECFYRFRTVAFRRCDSSSVVGQFGINL